ncbi:MAG: 30S ribosomal protein S7 [Spirochaetota bacterium]|nr:30S ribosomal protein S7 [Spirochaetota bacterium]
MGRRNKAQIRSVQSDSVYNDILIAKFINKVMVCGKKSLAERIVYSALDKASKKSGKSSIETFGKALENCKPLIEVRSRRVGGATYQVPVEVRTARQNSLAMRWLIQYSRERTEKSMVDKLSNELLDAYNNVGKTIKKREETHKMAEANKAFAHFKW